MGVTCIKTDFGENIHMDAVYKGMKPELLNKPCMPCSIRRQLTK